MYLTLNLLDNSPVQMGIILRKHQAQVHHLSLMEELQEPEVANTLPQHSKGPLGSLCVQSHTAGLIPTHTGINSFVYTGNIDGRVQVGWVVG